MKIIALADTHLGLTVGRTVNARKYIADKMFESFNHTLDKAKSDDTDLVLHGGDLFNRSKPPKYEIKRSLRRIEDLLHTGIGFVAVPGNHDRAQLPDSLWQYYFDNYHYFNLFSTFQLEEISITGFPFEYNNPREKFEFAIKQISNNPKEPNIILCHQLFRGAEFGPHRFRFTNQEDVIQTRFLPKNLKLVISGHIHRAQMICEQKVIYPGSIARTDFTEIIEPKGYVKILIEDDYVETEFIPIPSIPMKVIETNVNNKKIKYSELMDQAPDGLVRCLVRFMGRKLSSDEIKQLYSKFDREHWPLIKFTPNKENRILHPLYSVYNGDFQFNKNQDPIQYERSASRYGSRSVDTVSIQL